MSMDNEYKDDERYEDLDDGVYLDTETEETVFVLSDDERERLSELLFGGGDEQDN